MLRVLWLRGSSTFWHQLIKKNTLFSSNRSLLEQQCLASYYTRFIYCIISPLLLFAAYIFIILLSSKLETSEISGALLLFATVVDTVALSNIILSSVITDLGFFALCHNDNISTPPATALAISAYNIVYKYNSLQICNMN